MSLLPMTGRARVLGDDVNTDYIISSRRKKETIDPKILSRFLLEDVDPAFAASIRPGDILVAGTNFGCGSAMEVAVTVPLAAGVRAVVAKSFSRTYLRNAMNNGLLLAVADTSGIAEGETLTLAGDAETLELRTGRGRALRCEPIPAFMLSMVATGGLVQYLKTRGSFK